MGYDLEKLQAVAHGQTVVDDVMLDEMEMLWQMALDAKLGVAALKALKEEMSLVRAGTQQVMEFDKDLSERFNRGERQPESYRTQAKENFEKKRSIAQQFEELRKKIRSKEF